MLDDRGLYEEEQMADLVTVEGIGYKRRNPWGVFGLSLVTIGIYYVVWWYKIYVSDTFPFL